jgi:hypothetical protein
MTHEVPLERRIERVRDGLAIASALKAATVPAARLLCVLVDLAEQGTGFDVQKLWYLFHAPPGRWLGIPTRGRDCRVEVDNIARRARLSGSGRISREWLASMRALDPDAFVPLQPDTPMLEIEEALLRGLAQWPGGGAGVAGLRSTSAGLSLVHRDGRDIWRLLCEGSDRQGRSGVLTTHVDAATGEVRLVKFDEAVAGPDRRR